MLIWNWTENLEKSLHCALCRDRLKERHKGERASLDKKAKLGLFSAERISKEFQQQVDCEGADYMNLHNEWQLKAKASVKFNGDAQTVTFTFSTLCVRCRKAFALEKTFNLSEFPAKVTYR